MAKKPSYRDLGIGYAYFGPPLDTVEKPAKKPKKKAPKDRWPKWYQPVPKGEWHAYGESGEALCGRWAWIGLGVPTGTRNKKPERPCCKECVKKAKGKT